MANFLDQSNMNILANYTPYVQQNPVEVMASVGQIKQQQYNEGLQQIQSQVERVAGMDVIKPIHKEYLQSKLNELQGKLRFVAAGDFSNYQLVNSVGGAISSVAKDPIIQNAAYSTQVYRKEQGRLEEAKKTGKSSVQNEAYFNKQFSDWIGDNNPSTQFNGQYIEYTDIDSKLRALVKDIPEVESAADIPFMRNADGSVVRDSNGKPMIDSAMVRTSIKGKSAQKILDNFASSLDENDIRQLGIDGWYHYKDASKESFKRDIASTYTSNKKRIKDNVIDLSVELKTNPNLTSKEKDDIEAKINSYNRTINSGELENQMRQDISNVDNIQDFESYKQQVYTQKFLGGLADAMSYESKKTTFETNPYKQTELEMAKIQLQYDKLKQDSFEFGMNYDLNLRKHNLEIAKGVKESQSGIGPAESRPLPTDIPEVTMETFSNDLQGITTQMQVFRNNNAKLIFGNKIDGKEGWEVEQMFRKLYETTNITPNEKMEPSVKRAIETYRAMNMDYLSKAGAYNQIQEESKKFEDVINRELPKIGDLTTSYGNTYSADDVVKVQREMAAIKSPSDEIEFIRRYNNTTLENVAVSLTMPVNQRRKENIEIMDFINRINNNPEIKLAISNKQQFQSQELAKRMPEYFSAVSTLDMENKPLESRVNAVIGNLNEIAATQGLDLDKNQQFDADQLAQWRSEKGDAAKAKVDYLLEKKGDGSGVLIVRRGTEQQNIPLNHQQLSKYFPEVSQRHPLQDELALATFSKNKTTNVAGITGEANGAASAKFMANDLPTGISGGPLANIVKFDIEGASTNDGGANDEYLVRMYVFDRKANLWKQDLLSYDYIRSDQILPKLQQVSPNVVSSLLTR